MSDADPTSSASNKVRELLAKRAAARAGAAGVQSSVGGAQSSGDDTTIPAKGIGRAQFLQKLREKRDKVGESNEESTGQLKTREALLARIKKNKEQTAQKSVESDNTTSQATSNENEKIKDLERIFEEMKVEPAVVLGESKRGSKGKHFQASANIIRLKIKENFGVFEYHVKMTPQVDDLRQKKKLIGQLVDTIGKTRTFDGSTLSLPKMLSNAVTVLQAETNSGEKVVVTLTVKRKRELKDCEQLFNVLFNKIFEILKYYEIKRNHYDPSSRMMVPAHKLEIWPGYINRVLEMDGGLMLVCDTSHKVLRNDNAYTIMQDVKKKMGSSTSGLKSAMEKALTGSIVMTEYNRCTTYRVDEIDMSKSPKSTFTTSSGEVSFIDYYKKAYDINIKDKDQPMLVHRMRRKEAQDTEEEKILLLVPELCRMTGLTDQMRADFRVMKDVAVHTRVSPDTRQKALISFLRNVHSNSEAVDLLDQWGLVLDKEPIRMDGRTLDSEKLKVGNDREFTVNSKADWGRESTNNNCLKTVAINSWHVVTTERNKQVTEGFIRLMKQLAPKMGIQVGQPSMTTLPNDRTESFMKDIGDNVTKNRNLQLIVIIVPMQREDRYAAIKKLCNSELPIPSQVVCSKTISNEKKVNSVVQKIALQINCKLGGELWGAKIPLKNLMVIGVDVYHDPARKHPSIVGVVASMNNTCSVWYSEAERQAPGKELVEFMMTCVGKLLLRYQEYNGCLPEHIILYRDGVGDGQVEHVSLLEAQRCEQLFETMGHQPQFAFIVVQKRINKKLFCLSGNKYENPPPGSVLDHTIMKKTFDDFLLVSQHVTQGVVTPTHYIVVRDTTQLTPDQIQKLSYKMTHMYYNWPGTVRVPAPCQYAHKMAYQIGECSKTLPAHQLTDRLFFL